MGGEAISRATEQAALCAGKNAAEILPVSHPLDTKVSGSKHTSRRQELPEALTILVRLPGVHREGCGTDAALTQVLDILLTVCVAHCTGAGPIVDDKAQCMLVIRA